MSRCTPCGKILSCEDSQLSTTGSVITIITFVSAYIVGLRIYRDHLKAAHAEEAQLMDSVYAKMKRFKWMELRFSRGLDMMDDDIMHLVRLRLTQGVDAIHSLDAGIRIDPGTRRLSRLKNRGKFVLKEAKLKELVQKIDDSLGDLSTLLNEISQEQMLAEIKLQNSLLQKIADGTCVHHESTSETRAPAEAARDGDPLATLTRPSAVHLAGRPRSSSSSFT